MIEILAVENLPEIQEGDDLASLLARAVRASGLEVAERDVFVIAQKVISKAEGRVVRLGSIEPSDLALAWARDNDKDARMVEVVLRESRRIVRMERGVIICETRHGFICANAGVDASNTAEGTAVLLPLDPDLSARHIRAALIREFGVEVAVIISDTFGRPWREGIANVAIGLAGIAPLADYRGQNDSHGRELRVTIIAVADELASAAELVMKKSAGLPVAVIRGFDYEARDARIGEIIRAAERDLFR
ncbi:MAG TPA: coenzyme F420-0:L-glutamate ligase [Blastocatellia bacterium]|nr:coenzyme F420-0:L-glutamate ligase [Blastocatellia bacterium]